MRSTGKVACWNSTYGFITRDDKQPDIFFPGTSAYLLGMNKIEPGTRVEFDAVPNPRRPPHQMAVNFKIIGEDK